MKKLSFFLYFIYFLTLIRIGCTKKEELTNHYRHVKIEGNRTITGRYPISKDLAKRADCYHFIYDDKGRLIKVEHLNNGKLKRGFHKPNDPIAQIKIEYYEGYEKWNYLDINGNQVGIYNIYSVRYKYNKYGNPISKFNYDINGKLRKDFAGVAQYSWILDNKGRRIKEIYFNEEGKRVYKKNSILFPTDSIFEKRYRYNLFGNVVEILNLDNSGHLIANRLGIAITRWKYDRHGNEVECSNFDRYEKLVGDSYRIAIKRWKYDKNGYMIEEKLLDSYKKLKEGSYNIAITRWKYDEYGNEIENSFFCTDNQLKVHIWGCAIIRHKYDIYNRLIESKYYGTDERLRKDRYGVAIYRYNYDANGNTYERLHLDENEQLIENKDGIAIIQFKYDKKGNRITIYLNKNREKID